MLVDMGSQLSVLNTTCVQENKNYFKGTPMLPVNNMNITTATNKWEKVKQQAYNHDVWKISCRMSNDYYE